MVVNLQSHHMEETKSTFLTKICLAEVIEVIRDIGPKA